MRILAIDPATTASGWAIMENEDVVDCGLIKSPSSQPVEKKLLKLYNELDTIVSSYHPGRIVIEDQFLKSNVKTIKALSWVRGVIMLLAAQRTLPMTVLSSKTAKKVATGKGSSTKALVKGAVCKKFNLSPTLDENISDAIAIGLAYFASNKEEDPTWSNFT